MTTIAVSNSEATAFKRCRRAWYLGQYRGLKPRRSDPTGARALGDLLHGALEVYYTRGQSQLDAQQFLIGSLWSAMIKYPESEADIQKEGDLADAMLDGYFEWLEADGADAELTVLGSELKLSAPSPHPDFHLVAKLDQLVTRGLFRGPLDFKTTDSLSTPLKTIHMREQGPWYCLMTEILGEEPVNGMIYRFLKKSKRTARATPPFYLDYPVRYGTDELALFWNRLFGVLSEISRVRNRLADGEDHRIVCYPTPTRDCSWDCDFFKVCPQFDDGRSDPEFVIETDYEVGNPYARYAEGPGADPTTSAPETSAAG